MPHKSHVRRLLLVALGISAVPLASAQVGMDPTQLGNTEEQCRQAWEDQDNASRAWFDCVKDNPFGSWPDPSYDPCGVLWSIYEDFYEAWADMTDCHNFWWV